MNFTKETTDGEQIAVKSRYKEMSSKIFKYAAIFIIVIASVIIVKDEIVWQLDPLMTVNMDKSDDMSWEGSACNVLGIKLHGDLLTYIPASTLDANDESTADQTASEDVAYRISEAQKDDNIKAIVLDIDSYGGYPVAGEEIAMALKIAKKPTVALIRGSGASAAYMAASGADKIFASENSDVGGIGVTMSYVDITKSNEREGLSYVSLSSGKFKDTGDPNKYLSKEEKELLMRDVNIIHQNFVEMVAENRNLDIEKVALLADGSTMLGEMALQNGLIDQIGGLLEVEQYLKREIGESAEICW